MPHYLLGMAEFEVATDYKSLKGVFAKDPASVENFCLHHCMERLQEYNFKITYIKGKANSIADTLSWYPINPVLETDGKLEENTCICNSIQGSPDIYYAISPRANTIEPCLQELIDLANEEYKELVMNLSNHILFNPKQTMLFGPLRNHGGEESRRSCFCRFLCSPLS